MSADPGRSEDEIFEEYLDRINAGALLDRDEVRRLYPAFAAGLIADLEVYESLQGASNPAEPLGRLGDFELRREIGRGGMGVVYDAWQESMGRRVALKVLPAGIAVDAKACMRALASCGKPRQQDG